MSGTTESDFCVLSVSFKHRVLRLHLWGSDFSLLGSCREPQAFLPKNVKSPLCRGI